MKREPPGAPDSPTPRGPSPGLALERERPWEPSQHHLAVALFFWPELAGRLLTSHTCTAAGMEEGSQVWDRSDLERVAPMRKE